MAKLVENVYGDALFELAVEQGTQDQILEECKAVAGILESNEDLLRIMNHPKIVKDEKLQVVENVFKGRVSNEENPLDPAGCGDAYDAVMYRGQCRKYTEHRFPVRSCLRASDHHAGAAAY